MEPKGRVWRNACVRQTKKHGAGRKTDRAADFDGPALFAQLPDLAQAFAEQTAAIIAHHQRFRCIADLCLCLRGLRRTPQADRHCQYRTPFRAD